MITEYLGIAYDEDRLSNEEQNELEKYCYELAMMLEEKIKNMGLYIVCGFGEYVTKFTKEELDNIPKVKRNINGTYTILEDK